MAIALLPPCEYRVDMSKSVRHSPGVGFGDSEKSDKIAYHRKWRRKVASTLHSDLETEVLPEPREVANSRRWAKDPRGWFAETCKLVPKLLRK